MKHVLPIKSTYVSGWGVWEALRELVQNAKDEEQQNDHAMRISYGDGWLHIDNEGADLTVNALLIGQTSKAGKRELRGEHGEGLDLAFLAAVRDNYDVEVLTQSERWVPKLEQRKEFNWERCLVVSTRKLAKPRTGVRVSVRMDRNTWLKHENRFLFLTPPKEAMETDAGTLILDEDRRGQIFVKGIYVMNSDKTYQFGFDLRDVKLDRDRRMVDDFDLRWELARIVRMALSREPDKYAPTVLGLLDKGSKEVESLGSQLEKGSKASLALAAVFREKHGEHAVPVGSMAESQALDRMGAKGVVVSASAVNALSRELGSFSEAKERMRSEVTRRYGWHELTDQEQANLERVQAAAKVISAGHIDVLQQLQVGDFSDEDIVGKCNVVTGEIVLARKRCGSYFDLVEDLIHELAHAVTLAADGTREHVLMIERMWRTLYEHALEPKPDAGPDLAF